MTITRLKASFAAILLLIAGHPAQVFARQSAQAEDAARPFRPRIAAIEGDEAARPLSARGAENLAALARLLAYVRYYHPSDASAEADWDTLTIAAVQRVEGAGGPGELAERLRSISAAVAPEIVIFESDAPVAAPELPQADHYLLWRHLGLGTGNSPRYLSERASVSYRPDPLRLELGGGVSVWLPMAVAVGAQEVPGASIELHKPAGFTPSGFDRDTRLAAVIIAWGAMEHFFPYFDVIRADWDSNLVVTLQRAALDEDDLAFRDTLRSLFVPLQDGHVRVQYPIEALGRLPIAVDWIEGRVVVTGVGRGTEGVAVGDIVLSVGEADVGSLIDEEEALTSGSPQTRQYMAVQALLIGRRRHTVSVLLETSDGTTVDRAMTYAYSDTPVSPYRPDPVTTFGDGIVYVNLSRFSGEAVREHLPLLAGASGLVFDLRGYPSGSYWYLDHLTDEAIRSPRFDTPIILRPHDEAIYREGGWTITPASPRFTSNVVFITDESAISFSESILGTIEDNRLADIVGQATAGANGNINRMLLPGGYAFMWTGMRVTKGDGSPHHAVGIQPTIPLEPTIAGIRENRDELLEHAIALVRSRLPES